MSTARNEGQSGVYFIRHAPTAHNLAGRFMGSLDPPIAPSGWSPEEIRMHLAESAVGYASPMQRARQTIETLLPSLQYHIDPRLRERLLGDWEGLTWDQVREGWPNAFLANGVLNPRFTPPGGEGLSDLWTRLWSFLGDMQTREPLPTVVVTHNGCIRTIKVILGIITLDDFFLESEQLARPFYCGWSNLQAAELREAVPFQ